ncbi:acyl-CoA dehydrogenase family protein [Streptomyces roseolus]|uniref:acyl-CoA dehydrogenase family protein n=1 Tax=Streptomyces roseolus TaxID=67358 RepID=UPI0036E3565A
MRYTPEQNRLRAELRACFAELVPDDAHGRYGDPAARKRFYRETVRRLGADGWLGVGRPVEYGGRGLTPMEQFVFFDEAAQAGVPLPLMALNTVGPTLMRYGSEEQKAYFLPRILSGELDFAIGYSEPDAGTDLAALRTRAVREGDTYVVDGQKIWTTNAGSPGAVLHGELERGYRSAVVFTFGGGNNQIQREIISWIGLGMPRVRR